MPRVCSPGYVSEVFAFLHTRGARIVAREVRSRAPVPVLPMELPALVYAKLECKATHAQPRNWPPKFPVGFTSLDSYVGAAVDDLGVNKGRQRTHGRQQDNRADEANDERSEGHERDRTRPLVRSVGVGGWMGGWVGWFGGLGGLMGWVQLGY